MKTTSLLKYSKHARIATFPKIKYDYFEDNEPIIEDFKNVIGFDVITVENMADDKGQKDDYNEYLLIYFEDGKINTYRNSYVSLFC